MSLSCRIDSAHHRCPTYTSPQTVLLTTLLLTTGSAYALALIGLRPMILPPCYAILCISWSLHFLDKQMWGGVLVGVSMIGLHVGTLPLFYCWIVTILGFAFRGWILASLCSKPVTPFSYRDQGSPKWPQLYFVWQCVRFCDKFA